MSNEIDKDALYGKFQKHEDAKNDLHLKAAHKALDVALGEDMNIDARKKVTNTGIGTLGALGIAAVSGLVPGLLALWFMLKQPADAPQQKPADTEYDVRFYD